MHRNKHNTKNSKGANVSSKATELCNHVGDLGVPCGSTHPLLSLHLGGDNNAVPRPFQNTARHLPSLHSFDSVKTPTTLILTLPESPSTHSSFIFCLARWTGQSSTHGLLSDVP